MLKSYVAILTVEEDSILVEFPDIPNAFTEGENIEEALFSGKEVLGVMLAYLAEEEKDFPQASTLNSIVKTLKENQTATLIQTDYAPYIRNTKAIKKTVTIPDWLNKKAEKENIPFSATLTEALKEKLGV